MKRIILSCLLAVFAVESHAQNEKFYTGISITANDSSFVEAATAGNIYTFFKSSPLFKWDDYNNCEDRANAISILLDSWGIPNYKVWIFSGQFLDKDHGLLTNRYGVRWKYHVAACVPVKVGNTLQLIALDPSTTQQAQDIAFWANNVIDKQYGYYFLTPGSKYIWGGKGKNMSQASFFDRNNTNYAYTIQGLAGFNGLNGRDRREMRSAAGKLRLKKAEQDFTALKSNKPAF